MQALAARRPTTRRFFEATLLDVIDRAASPSAAVKDALTFAESRSQDQHVVRAILLGMLQVEKSEKYQSLGWVENKDGGYVLTAKGRDVLNELQYDAMARACEFPEPDEKTFRVHYGAFVSATPDRKDVPSTSEGMLKTVSSTCAVDLDAFHALRCVNRATGSEQAYPVFTFWLSREFPILEMVFQTYKMMAGVSTLFVLRLFFFVCSLRRR